MWSPFLQSTLDSSHIAGPRILRGEGEALHPRPPHISCTHGSRADRLRIAALIESLSISLVPPRTPPPSPRGWMPIHVVGASMWVVHFDFLEPPETMQNQAQAARKVGISREHAHVFTPLFSHKIINTESYKLPRLTTTIRFVFVASHRFPNSSSMITVCVCGSYSSSSSAQ